MPSPNDASADLEPRLAALRLLDAALLRRDGMDQAASSKAFLALPVRDRAFARALTLATLRRLGPIDRALDAKLQREPPPVVRQILRLGAAQAFWLDTPDFAAVDTSVRLAERFPQSQRFKALVNAVLRGLLRDGPPADDPESLAPPWLFARWSAAYGAQVAGEIAAVIPEEPATDLSLRDLAEADAVAASLEGEALPGGSVRTPLRGDIAGWPGYETGAWWVQDAAAAVPARLLAVRPGETALDLCAAPGGKTLQLAATGAAVTAVDRSAARLQRLSESLARTDLAAEVIAADALTWPDTRVFDAVLLDAPCSATGTFRRHPDVLWAARPSDVASLAAVQSAMLDRAADRVKPGGGRLVYCVCSLEPEEGEAQVAAFLARRGDFALDPVRAGEGGAPTESLTAQGMLRLLPHHRPGGQDGFFAARLIRR